LYIAILCNLTMPKNLTVQCELEMNPATFNHCGDDSTILPQQLFHYLSTVIFMVLSYCILMLLLLSLSCICAIVYHSSLPTRSLQCVGLGICQWWYQKSVCIVFILSKVSTYVIKLGIEIRLNLSGDNNHSPCHLN